MLQSAPLIPAVLTAACAGVLDWRFRRIPNWLTVSGAVAGLVVNTLLFGFIGLKSALLGLAVGLGLLLPFVLLRSLGAGDWKLAGALGACLGPRQLITVLMVTILVAGGVGGGGGVLERGVRGKPLIILPILGGFFLVGGGGKGG